jgi:hypothetical protein
MDLRRRQTARQTLKDHEALVCRSEEAFKQELGSLPKQPIKWHRYNSRCTLIEDAQAIGKADGEDDPLETSDGLKSSMNDPKARMVVSEEIHDAQVKRFNASSDESERLQALTGKYHHLINRVKSVLTNRRLSS